MFEALTFCAGGGSISSSMPGYEFSCGRLASVYEMALPNFHRHFQELAKHWRNETGHFSSISKKLQHPAYREIIEMGEKAIPLILMELLERPGHWFDALRILAQESPVPAQNKSDPKLAREAWLEWGKKKGFIK